MTTVLVAQLNYALGDAGRNREKILAECCRTKESGLPADIAVFGRYAIPGYITKFPSVPGEFIKLCEANVELLAAATSDMHVLVGGVSEKKGIFNEVIYLLSEGKCKKLLEIPVFSQDSSDKCTVFQVRGLSIALLLEEYTLCTPSKTWLDAYDMSVLTSNIDLFILLGRSPYGSYGLMNHDSVSVIVKHSRFIYLNMLGGYEGSVFPGGSMIHCPERADASFSLWEEDKKLFSISSLPSHDSQPLMLANNISFPGQKNALEKSDSLTNSENTDLQNEFRLVKFTQQVSQVTHSYEEFVYQLLLLSLRDFVKKNAFAGVLLGLSGGIDSALVATLAADALGSECVRTFMLPTRYTSQSSIDDAHRCADSLGIAHSVIHMEDIFLAYIKSLGLQFETSKFGLAEENVQSRIRGTFLMAVSNITNFLLLATGNRSELLTGYMTLYGDTCGGFAPIKDVYKTQVYDLVRWRNSNVPYNSMCKKTNVIPETVIKKAPTAELKFNQRDQDSLPEYSKLDKMLSMLIDRSLTKEELVLSGYDSCDVEHVISMIKKSYFKLNQVAPGPCIMRTLENTCNNVLS